MTIDLTGVYPAYFELPSASIQFKVENCSEIYDEWIELLPYILSTLKASIPGQ